MPSFTVRNIAPEIHRAIRIRAIKNDNSVEAEIRSILEQVSKPKGHLRLGSLLSEIRQKVQLDAKEYNPFKELRSNSELARTVEF